MTQDEIIEMARQVGVSIRGYYDETGSTPKELEAFANLVAAKERESLRDEMWDKALKLVAEAVKLEREACALIAEKQRYAMNICLTSNPVQNGTAVGIANQIRARGEALAFPIIESYLEKDNLEEDLYDLAIKADNGGQP